MLGLCRNNGKENGNFRDCRKFYTRFRVLGFGVSLHTVFDLLLFRGVGFD